MEQQRYICQMIEKIDEQITALYRTNEGIKALTALQKYKDSDWGAVKSHMEKSISIDCEFLIEVLSKVKTDYQRRLIELG